MKRYYLSWIISIRIEKIYSNKFLITKKWCILIDFLTPVEVQVKFHCYHPQNLFTKDSVIFVKVLYFLLFIFVEIYCTLFFDIYP